jgi:hypothetical protein
MRKGGLHLSSSSFFCGVIAPKAENDPGAWIAPRRGIEISE